MFIRTNQVHQDPIILEEIFQNITLRNATSKIKNIKDNNN